jgi:hypothetical protein
MITDARIDAFRQTVEHLTSIPCILNTLSVTLHRANELPDLIAQARYPGERQRFKEEHAAIGYATTHRIRQSQLENELHHGLYASREPLRAAIDSATEHVGTAAGGPELALSFPFVRYHLNKLARHRVLPPATESTAARLAFIESAWQAIDFAMASLNEIRFDAQVRGSGLRL